MKSIKASVAKRAPIVEPLVRLFKECAQSGVTATYELIEQRTGVNYRKSGRRHDVYRALAVLREQYSLAFVCETGVGYKPIPNDEIVEAVEGKALSKIYRAHANWHEGLSCVNIAQLSQPGLEKYSLSALKNAVLGDALEKTETPELAEYSRTHADSLLDLRNTRNILGELVS